MPHCGMPVLNMGNYVKKPKDITGLKVSLLCNNKASSEDWEGLANAKRVPDSLSHQLTAGKKYGELLKLTAILSGEVNIPQERDSEDEESYESGEVRSIVSFYLLPQHIFKNLASSKWKSRFAKDHG